MKNDSGDMRKVDLLVVLSVIALGSYGLTYKTISKASSPTPTTAAAKQDDLVTDSGKWKILPTPYQLGQLSLGMHGDQIKQLYGNPTNVVDPKAETQIWVYESKRVENVDGQQLPRRLSLVVLDGRLLSVTATGYTLTRDALLDRPVCQSGFNQKEVESALGQPATKLDSNWTYQQSQCELEIDFEASRVSSIRLASQVQSRPLDQIKPIR